MIKLVIVEKLREDGKKYKTVYLSTPDGFGKVAISPTFKEDKRSWATFFKIAERYGESSWIED